MRLYVARQQIEFEFLTLSFLRLLVFLCRCWLRLGNCRDGYAVAEVLFHELRDLGFQLFRRRKWWWRWWVLCHVETNIVPKPLRGNVLPTI